MRQIKFALLPLFLLVCAGLSGKDNNCINYAVFASKADQVLKDGIYADYYTSKGRIIVRLDYKKAPMTVANFIGLAEGTITNASCSPGTSFYKESVWHRVVKGHVIQGGSPAIDKAPEKEEVTATGYVIPNEISDLSHNKAGILGMANSGPHTNTCQYYITLGDRSYLDGIYTVFGEVVEGMDVVYRIEQGDTTRSISIIRVGEDAQKFIVNDLTFRHLLDEQWSKVKKEEAMKTNNDEKFIKENWPGLTVTQGGLRYKILVQGKGERPVIGSEISALYTGRLTDGRTFVSTSDAGRPSATDQPSVFVFNADNNRIIKGIKAAVTDMKKGEKRLLIVPADLAYGENGFFAKDIPGQKRFVIPPREILILEVTLISFK